MKIAQFAMATLAAIGLSGCASIAGDNTRAVQVNSIPSGATVLVDNQEYGTTPTVVTLPSYIYGGKTVMVRKNGYHDQALQVNTAFQPIALLDIFFWPSFIIDGATGSLVKVDPANRNLNAHLARG